MTEIVWLLEQVVLSLHEEQLAEHGGGVGVRDRGLLESALLRPQQLAHYGTAQKGIRADIAAMAAAYGFGLVKNHPFIDGNKRVAFVVVEVFLMLNGVYLNANDEDCVTTMLQLAAGEIDEAAFADWIRQNI